MKAKLKQLKKKIQNLFVFKKRKGAASWPVLFIPGVGGTVFLVSNAVAFFKGESTNFDQVLFGPFLTIYEGLAKLWMVIFSGLIKLIVFVLIQFLQYSNFINEKGIIEGWTILRDIANMFFIILFLVMAVGTILKNEKYSWQKMLIPLALMAIFINFSRTICGLIIDFSQVVMLTFVNAFKDIGGGNLIQLFGLDKFMSWDATVNTANSTQGVGMIQVAALLSLGVTVSFICLVVFVIVTVILAIRIVALWFLIALSPLAFICYVVPGLQSYAKMWQDKFFYQVIVGPVLAFFIWLSFMVVEKSNETLLTSGMGAAADQAFKNAETQAGTTIPVLGEASFYIGLILGAGMLIGALMAAKKLGVAGAGMAGQGISFIQKSGQKAVGAVAQTAGYFPKQYGKRIGYEAGGRVLNSMAALPLVGSFFAKKGSQLRQIRQQSDEKEESTMKFSNEKNIDRIIKRGLEFPDSVRGESGRRSFLASMKWKARKGQTTDKNIIGYDMKDMFLKLREYGGHEMDLEDNDLYKDESIEELVENQRKKRPDLFGAYNLDPKTAEWTLTDPRLTRYTKYKKKDLKTGKMKSMYRVYHSSLSKTQQAEEIDGDKIETGGKLDFNKYGSELRSLQASKGFIAQDETMYANTRQSTPTIPHSAMVDDAETGHVGARQVQIYAASAALAALSKLNPQIVTEAVTKWRAKPGKAGLTPTWEDLTTGEDQTLDIPQADRVQRNLTSLMERGTQELQIRTGQSVGIGINKPFLDKLRAIIAEPSNNLTHLVPYLDGIIGYIERGIFRGRTAPTIPNLAKFRRTKDLFAKYGNQYHRSKEYQEKPNDYFSPNRFPETQKDMSEYEGSKDILTNPGIISGTGKIIKMSERAKEMGATSYDRSTVMIDFEKLGLTGSAMILDGQNKQKIVNQIAEELKQQGKSSEEVDKFINAANMAQKLEIVNTGQTYTETKHALAHERMHTKVDQMSAQTKKSAWDVLSEEEKEEKRKDIKEAYGGREMLEEEIIDEYLTEGLTNETRWKVDGGIQLHRKTKDILESVAGPMSQITAGLTGRPMISFDQKGAGASLESILPMLAGLLATPGAASSVGGATGKTEVKMRVPEELTLALKELSKGLQESGAKFGNLGLVVSALKGLRNIPEEMSARNYRLIQSLEKLSLNLAGSDKKIGKLLKNQRKIE